MDTITLAMGFSLVVGVVFGVWPARTASKLEPIDALRFE
jgi:ABC-type antimicrobial peptide transport system permease subunit